MKNDREVQTVELTAKRLKAQQVLSTLTIVLGIVLMVVCFRRSALNGVTIGGLIALVGMLWLWITRVRIWWNHK